MQTPTETIISSTWEIEPDGELSGRIKIIGSTKMIEFTFISYGRDSGTVRISFDRFRRGTSQFPEFDSDAIENSVVKAWRCGTAVRVVLTIGNSLLVEISDMSGDMFILDSDQLKWVLHHMNQLG